MTSVPDMFPHTGLPHGTCRVTCQCPQWSAVSWLTCFVGTQWCRIMSDEMMSCDGDSSSLTIVVCVTRPSVTLNWPWGPGAVLGSPRAKWLLWSVRRSEVTWWPGELWAEDNCWWSESCWDQDIEMLGLLQRDSINFHSWVEHNCWVLAMSLLLGFSKKSLEIRRIALLWLLCNGHFCLRRFENLGLGLTLLNFS